jgi:hypothetical protein
LFYCVYQYILSSKMVGEIQGQIHHIAWFVKAGPYRWHFNPIKWFPFASTTSGKGNWCFNANMLLSSLYVVDILGFLGLAASSF